MGNGASGSNKNNDDDEGVDDLRMKMVKERTKFQSITEKNIIIHDIAK
jgi:hypothetical protein